MLRTVSRSVARQSRSLRISNRAPQLLRPISTTACRMSSSTLKPVDPPVSAALPGDSFQLLSEASKAGQAEDALFDEQVQQVRDWWASPRYRGIKRPYSAEDIVSKRGALQQTYPSSLMARKLFNLFEERAAKGEPVHTSALTFQSRRNTIANADSSLFSGSNRSRTNDPTSPQPRSAVHLWLGMLLRPHYHERSVCRLRRLPLQHRSESSSATLQGAAAP